MEVLNVSHLYKKFGTKEIIHDVNFNIEEGEIVGFVGPNGAGKTTTMKLICNLIFPTSGEIKIDGFDVIKEREKALSSISALIENPGLYGNLSGMQNLKMIQRLNGNTDEEVKDIIKQIGLEDRIHRKASKYSLGMKQRLAIGMCLLSNPKFLILDEPTNGLDPTGIIDLRKFIEKLAAERHIAILLSSHILSEVEKICSRIIFIKDGRIVSQSSTEVKDEFLYKVKVSEIDTANKIFMNNEFITETSVEDNNSILIRMKDNHINDVIKDIVEKDIEILDIEKQKTDLESIYYNIFKE